MTWVFVHAIFELLELFLIQFMQFSESELEALKKGHGVLTNLDHQTTLIFKFFDIGCKEGHETVGAQDIRGRLLVGAFCLGVCWVCDMH